MAYTLTVEPDDDSLGWLIFVDHKPVHNFNSNLQATLALDPGTHRLVIDARGSGSTVKVSIDGNATLTDPAGAWPLSVTVPADQTGKVMVATFTT